MDLLRPSDLRSLLEIPEGASVSVYMPTHRAGPETRQDPIRLKNLLGEAEERLIEAGRRGPEARDLLAPAATLLEDEAWWRHQGDGLALFLATDFGRVFRLPRTFEERVVVGERFHVKPLIPLVTGDGRFLVLALSRNEIRLLQGTRQTLQEVELEDVPGSLRETAVHREVAVLNYHVGTGFSSGGRRSAVFHGHGTEVDEELIRTYFRRIDAGIREAIGDERSPLVIAAVRHEAELYRAVGRYANILPRFVEGNPDETSDRDLHREASRIARAHFDREREEAVARFREQGGPGLAISGVDRVVPAAHHGRVETLWVSLAVERWGSFDEETDTVEVRETPKPGDHDLLDLAAIQTLLAGGTVYAAETGDLPGDGPISALLRY